MAKRKGTKKRKQTADGRNGGIVAPASDQSGMNDQLFQRVIEATDPPEWHFTEPMAWRGTSFVVFPGISDDSVFSFRHLVRALDIPPEFYAHPVFISDATRPIGAVLRLSSVES